MNREPLGKRLHELRVRRGLSQARLAAPELSASYISLIESGKRKPPRRTIAALARKLGCSLAYLEHGYTEESPARLADRLRRARATLDDGSAAEALSRFTELLDSPGIEVMAPRLHLRARLGRAMCLDARGRSEEAIHELERAARTIECADRKDQSDWDEHDWDAWAALQHGLCLCHGNRGDLVEAIAVADRALARLRAADRPATDIGVRLGVRVLEAHRSLGDAFTARRIAGQLLRTVDAAGAAGPWARMMVYSHATATFEEHGDHATAVRLAERALAAAAELDAELDAGLDADRDTDVSVTERVDLLMLIGRSGAERARALLLARRRELTRPENGGPKNGDRELAGCVTELARLELALGCPSEAATLAHRAHALLAGPPSRAAARALAVLGHALVRLGRHQDAIDALTRCADCLERAGYVRQAARAWYDVAEVTGGTGGGYQRQAAAYRRALTLIGLATGRPATAVTTTTVTAADGRYEEPG